MSQRDVRALAPLVTVYNPDGKVNVLSASRAVLEALPGLAPPSLEDIIARRRDPTPESIRALKASLGAVGDSIKIEPGPAYRVHVTARGHNARARSMGNWIDGRRDREMDAPSFDRQEDMAAELKRLRRENEVLRQERDPKGGAFRRQILKRATAFFAREGSR